MQEEQITNQLIQSCKQQNNLAFEKLFTFIQPKIFLICKRYLKNPEDQFDILQEVSIKIYTKIHQFDERKGKFEAWVYRITTNECFKFLQRKKEEILWDVEQFQFIPHQENEKEVVYDSSKILQTIEKLKNGQKTIVKLYLIEGYTHDEIASILNISVNTSKSQLSRAKDRLKEIMTKEYPNMDEYL